MTHAERLLAAMELPECFAPSPNPLWDDEHISKQMLAAHLDPEFAGASRSPDFMNRSAALIAEVMPPARFPRLCDYGCGPGLYLQRLAPMGYACTGLDISARSIDFARAQAAGQQLAINYRQFNYLQPQPPAVYDAALLIYCDYGALSAAARATLLGNIYTSLAPGGRLLLDVFCPEKLAAFTEQQSWRAFPKGGFWNRQPHLALQRNLKYPQCISLEQTAVLAGDEPLVYYIWNQYFTGEMLAAEATAAGFTVAATWADVAGAPPDATSPTLAALLEKPQ